MSAVLTCPHPPRSLSVAPEIHMLKHFKGDSIVVKKGDSIEIPADVLGLPVPKIEWSKDDVIIQQPTESLLMETETTGRMNCKTKLSVPSANRRDRGNYTVTASNNMGSAKHTVSVMVLGELEDTCSALSNLLPTHCTVFLCRPPSAASQPGRVQHQGRVLLPPLGRSRGQRWK